MSKIAAWLFLAAILVGIAGLAITTETASAIESNLDCSQTVDPSGEGTKGEVTCTLSITDLPDPLGDIELTLVASYVDEDGSGDPSPGDSLQCITVSGSGPGGPIDVSIGPDC